MVVDLVCVLEYIGVGPPLDQRDLIPNDGVVCDEWSYVFRYLNCMICSLFLRLQFDLSVARVGLRDQRALARYC